MWNQQVWDQCLQLYGQAINKNFEQKEASKLFLIPINEAEEYKIWLISILKFNLLNKLEEVSQFDQYDLFQRLYSYILPLVYIQCKRLRTRSKIIIGLNGMQGAGKTTLGTILAWVFQSLNISFTSLSVDDFYSTFQERQQLDPYRYPFRGPPGTHNVGLINQVLEDWKKDVYETIQVPFFDKSLQNGKGDRGGYKEISGKGQIMYFEGWLTSFCEEDEEIIKLKQKELILPDRSLLKDIDLLLYMNKQLIKYEQIWKKFDYLVAIEPEDITYSYQWRLEAEQKMRESKGMGMNDKEVFDMVSYFWKCLHPQIYVIS